MTTNVGVADPLAEARRSLERPFSSYADDHKPLGAYAALSGGFAAAVVGSIVAIKRSRRPLPERPAASDVVLIGIATHKLSRLIAKDKVTSFLRAPFTTYQEASGQGEVEERPRGRGLQLALGELLGCPYCLGQWIAATFGVGLVAAPRFTRLVAAIYTAETIADFLQVAYSAAESQD